MNESELIQWANALIRAAKLEGKAFNVRPLSPSRKRRAQGLRLVQVTCIPTGEVYYGVRVDDPRTMMQKLKAPQGGYTSPIAKALVRHGADAFQVQVL